MAKIKQFGIYSHRGDYVGAIFADRAESGGFNHFMVYRGGHLIAIVDRAEETGLPVDAIADAQIKDADSTSAADSRAATKE